MTIESNLADEQQALQGAIVTLLALAEATPALPPAVLAGLKPLADRLPAEPGAQDLAAWMAVITVALRDQPAFVAARRTWQAALPLRVGLDLSPLNNWPNPVEGTPPDLVPHADPALALAQARRVVADEGRRAVRDPAAFAVKLASLSRLAQVLGLPWPRQGASA